MPLVALLDTNVWVSAFLKPTGPPGQVIAKWRRDDNAILEAAIFGQSQYLVTRDDDLKRDLDLIRAVRRHRVRVVSVRQFLRRLSRRKKT